MRKSRLSKYKQSHLIELFAASTTARTAASLVGMNKTSASYYFRRLHTELQWGATGEEGIYFANITTE